MLFPTNTRAQLYIQLDYPLICLKIYLCSFLPCNSFAECRYLSLRYVDLSDNKLAESPSTCLAVTPTVQGVPVQGPGIERLRTDYDTESDRSTFTSTQPIVKYSLYTVTLNNRPGCCKCQPFKSRRSLAAKHRMLHHCLNYRRPFIMCMFINH